MRGNVVKIQAWIGTAFALALAAAGTGWCAENAAVAADTNSQPLMVIDPLDYPGPGMVTDSGRERLRFERAMIAREMYILPTWRSIFGQAKPYLLPMPKERVDELVRKMNEGAADTPQDNIRRFAELMAGRLEQFRKGYEHYRAGRWAEAVVDWSLLLAEKVTLIKQPYQHDTMPPYAYSITRFLRGECHGRIGNAVECVQDYQVALLKMPRSLTFLPVSCMQAAKVYEATERGHFAVPIYEAFLEGAVGALSDTETLRLRVKVMKMMREDPYRLVLQDAADSVARLEKAGMGTGTQRVQSRLLGNMPRLLIDAVGEGRPFLEYSLALVGQAIEGASLQEGKSTDRFMFSNDVEVVGTDDWGQLRPRERQELIQMFNETYPDRYREMLEQYFRNLSDRESKK
jgi:hypothetical protein